MGLQNRRRDFTAATAGTIRQNTMGEREPCRTLTRFWEQYGEYFDEVDLWEQAREMDTHLSLVRGWMSEVTPLELDDITEKIVELDRQHANRLRATGAELKEYGRVVDALTGMLGSTQAGNGPLLPYEAPVWPPNTMQVIEDWIRRKLKDRHIKDAVIDVILEHPFAALRVLDCTNIAEAVELILFGKVEDGSQENGYRHAFWNALMTYYIGEDLTKEFADAHEVQDSQTTITPELEADTAMDLHNNAVGRAIGNRVSAMSLAEIHEALMGRLGDESQIQASLSEYSVTEPELLILLLTTDAYREAIACEYVDGKLIPLNGQSIDGKIVFVVW